MNTTLSVKKKTVYGIRTRMQDSDPWSEPTWYRTAKQRDRIGSMNRIIGGIRTWSFQEKKTMEEIESMDFD